MSTNPWWTGIEAEIAAATADDAETLPDPWADLTELSPVLTSDQAAFLAGLDDQPGVSRLRNLDERVPGTDGDATGNAPGDTETEDS
jgi:hypothetical protein